MDTKNIKHSKKIEKLVEAMEDYGYAVEDFIGNKKLNVFYHEGELFMDIFIKTLNKAKKAMYINTSLGWTIFVDREEKDILAELKRIEFEFTADCINDSAVIDKSAEFHIKALRDLGYNIDVNLESDK